MVVMCLTVVVLEEVKLENVTEVRCTVALRKASRSHVSFQRGLLICMS